MSITYLERLKAGSTIDCRQLRTILHRPYCNNFENVTIWSVNSGGPAAMQLTMIDEAEAFTVNMQNVAIIPLELFDCLRKVANGLEPAETLIDLYNSIEQANPTLSFSNPSNPLLQRYKELIGETDE